MHMAYEAKDYSKLIGMDGFSEPLLKHHFTLYNGYVTNTHKVLDLVDQLIKADKGASPEFAETKRRLGWEFNGMRLHEYYFDNLVGTEKLSDQPSVTDLITHSFGSIERWKNDFMAAGAMRGIGWVILYHDS